MKVVGINEVGEMLPEAFMCVVVEALDGGFFEGSIDALDLAVGPGMFGLAQAVVDIGLGAGELEGISAEEIAVVVQEIYSLTSRWITLLIMRDKQRLR